MFQINDASWIVKLSRDIGQASHIAQILQNKPNHNQCRHQRANPRFSRRNNRAHRDRWIAHDSRSRGSLAAWVAVQLLFCLRDEFIGCLAVAKVATHGTSWQIGPKTLLQDGPVQERIGKERQKYGQAGAMDGRNIWQKSECYTIWRCRRKAEWDRIRCASRGCRMITHTRSTLHSYDQVLILERCAGKLQNMGRRRVWAVGGEEGKKKARSSAAGVA